MLSKILDWVAVAAVIIATAFSFLGADTIYMLATSVQLWKTLHGVATIAVLAAGASVALLLARHVAVTHRGVAGGLSVLIAICVLDVVTFVLVGTFIMDELDDGTALTLSYGRILGWTAALLAIAWIAGAQHIQIDLDMARVLGLFDKPETKQVWRDVLRVLSDAEGTPMKRSEIADAVGRSVSQVRGVMNHAERFLTEDNRPYIVRPEDRQTVLMMAEQAAAVRRELEDSPMSGGERS